MRVDEPPGGFPGFAHSIGRFGIVKPAAVVDGAEFIEQFGFDPVDAVRFQSGHACGRAHGIHVVEIIKRSFEVARDQNIHRRRRRPHEISAAVVDARFEEVAQDMVGVASNDEAANGQPQRLGKPAGKHVAVIAGRDAEVDAFALTDNAGFCELAVGVKVINHLRRKTADIDGIGARERNVSRGELGFERRSEERLHRVLSIVEIPAERCNFHVDAFLRCHLQALNGAHAPVRVKDCNTDARNVSEPFKRGFPGVAARCRGNHEPAAGAG